MSDDHAFLMLSLLVFWIGVGLGVWFGWTRGNPNVIWGLHQHIQHLKDINHQLRVRLNRWDGDGWKD